MTKYVHPFTSDQLKDIAAYGVKSDHMGDFTDWLWDWCYDSITPGKGWQWPLVLGKLGYSLVDDNRKLFLEAGKRASDEGLLADCWSRDDRAKFMGRPVLVWRNPDQNQPDWKPPRKR